VEFILKIFDVMRRAAWNNFQILTKRSERLVGHSPQLPWRPHIWMGVGGINGAWYGFWPLPGRVSGQTTERFLGCKQ
jgi:protein gp37